MSRIIFLCLPRSSKFQEYVQCRKCRNLFCFLKSDVNSCYSGAFEKSWKRKPLRCFETKTRTCPVSFKMYVKTYHKLKISRLCRIDWYICFCSIILRQKVFRKNKCPQKYPQSKKTRFLKENNN